ncbi:unnamed protein product, partial [Cylicocyclus nassatus]
MTIDLYYPTIFTTNSWGTFVSVPSLTIYKRIALQWSKFARRCKVGGTCNIVNVISTENYNGQWRILEAWKVLHEVLLERTNVDNINKR